MKKHFIIGLVAAILVVSLMGATAVFGKEQPLSQSAIAQKISFS